MFIVALLEIARNQKQNVVDTKIKVIITNDEKCEENTLLISVNANIN